VFLRTDADIAADVRAIFTDILFTDPVRVKVTVKQGVVILAGQAGEPEEMDVIPVATRLIWDIDGVVDVMNKLAVPQPG
jgi:osmotically-inducible protein OsmY